jgi:predicted kinase
MMLMNTIYVLIGPPLTGKTTFTRNWLPADIVVLSTDDIRMELGARDHGAGVSYNQCYSLVDTGEMRREFNNRYDTALRERRDIVADLTNMRSNNRRKLLARVPKAYRRVAVLFDWEDRDMLYARNRVRSEQEGKFIPLDVINNFIDMYEPVVEEEGFDEVIEVANFMENTSRAVKT